VAGVGEKKRPAPPREEEILLQWGVQLAEEIESLSSQGGSAIRHGHLQDALEEASVVLEMAGYSDLARAAQDLAERLAELRRRGGMRLTVAMVDNVRRSAKRLAGEMKHRMEERLAASTTSP